MHIQNIKIIVGHCLGVIPTKKERESTKLREKYRERLNECRVKYGNWIPFEYNLELLMRNK